MAAVALVVTNVGLVQLASVQPAPAAVVSSLVFSENFDGVSPPALPDGWNAIRADGRTSDQTWRTSTPGFTTVPNKASVASYGHVTDMILESPAFVAGAATKLRFYKQAIMQATTGQFSGDNLDGAVLEIKIGTAGYVDFLAAGGTFNAGEGYSRRIASTQDNPLGGRMGWSGHQLGSSVTNATFPNSATGQTVRLRWRLGTSRHTANQGGTNFFQDQAFAIDSVEVFSDKTTQTISFTSTAPFRPQVWTTYTPTATASSGLPVTFSIAPGSTCSIAAGVVTFETPGICDIQADQAGNASFAVAPRATQGTFAVKADQIMSFTSTAPENPQVGTTYTPTATTSSGGVITISIAAGSSSVCSIGAANLVTFNAPGSCVIQADQAGNSNLNPAQVTQTVNVVAAPLPAQTISFTSTAPSSPQAFTTYTPTATATSGLAVTFSIASGSVCSLAGGVVTFETPGPCTIQADQAGNASFAPAPRVTQSMTVVKADQTVSFTSSAPENPQVGTTYTPTAAASSGGPITFSIAAGSSSVCSIGVANLVTFNDPGSCVIQADQVGNANLNPAPRVTQTVNVVAASPGSQTISFTSSAPSNPQVGGTYTPTASATSGLSVSFSIASGSSAVCSLGAANLVTFNAAGSCVIQADQAGNASFAAATQVTQNVNVVAASPGSQTISFTSTAPVNPQVAATYTPVATASSGLPVTFSIASGSIAVCSLGAANMVTFNGTGSCVIQADQAGNASFAAATQVTQNVNVVATPPGPQTISFTSTAPVKPQVGATYTPVATATSGLPVTISIAAASTSVCSIGGANLVTFNTTGSCVIQADQAGNASFNAALRVTQNVNVGPPQADVSVAKTDGPDPVVAGSNIAYTITVANSVAGSTAANVSLTDTIPAHTTFVSRNVPAGWNCAAQAAGTTNPLSCTRATLTPADANQVFTLVVKVNLQISSATAVINTATVSATGDTATSGNNLATATTAVTFAPSRPAVVRGSTSWLLRNSLTTGGADTSFTYGIKPLAPFFGDWDGNGTKTAGSYEGGVFKLKNANDSSGADHTFSFGDARGFPVAGDFNGDGTDDVAVFRDGVWQVHYVGTGVPPDATFSFGPALSWPSVVPVAGDWNGDGIDGIGVYNLSSAPAGQWYLGQTASGGTVSQTVTYGGLGLYPVVGDWDGDGVDSLGTKANAGTTWAISNSNTTPATTATFEFGQSGDIPESWR